MKSVHLALVFVSTLPFVCPVSAEASNIVGYGYAKCRDIMAVVINEQDRTLEVFQWAAGYMSGLNAADILDRKQYRDFEGLFADNKTGPVTQLLLTDCISNPDMRFADVVGRFWMRLPVRTWANQ